MNKSEVELDKILKAIIKLQKQLDYINENIAKKEDIEKLFDCRVATS